MNRPLKMTGLLAAALLIVFLTLSAGCLNKDQQSPGNNLSEFKPGTLTIRGDGTEHSVRYKVSELKNLQDALASGCYSTVNNVGTKSCWVGKGVQLSYLLKQSGIKDSAKIITVMGRDGYTAVFTREQLEEQRYYFPGLMEGSEEGAEEVPAILAWEYQERQTDLSKASNGPLCLLIGQTGLNNVVVPAYVKDVVLIEISISDPGQWDRVSVSPKPGKVQAGTDIILSHPEMDSVKIYYTLDGSTPNEKSLMYNPGTSYFKPELNHPIAIDRGVIIKAAAIGFGKRNSPAAEFQYDF